MSPDYDEVFADAQREQDRIDREERWLTGALIVIGLVSVACLVALVVLV